MFDSAQEVIAQHTEEDVRLGPVLQVMEDRPHTSARPRNRARQSAILASRVSPSTAASEDTVRRAQAVVSR